ncbi:MAG TPA: NAD-dependent epimerase/dehydratase family protein [Actinobacteria bacterium]|nr:NAD-dependent epimerase/dehydratase family protein [Actinomycetota bacterium]
MTPRRILVTGASGYLGRRVVRAAAGVGEVVGTVHRNVLDGVETVVVDLTDRASVHRIVKAIRPAAIIHTAAVNPGRGDEGTMWRVNVDGSRHVAEAARAVGARLVAVSTDVVHDGTAAPYPDDARPSPSTGYGRSKAEAERVMVEALASTTLVRTSLVYDLDEMDRGTAGFAARLAAGEEVGLFSDVVRQPIRAETLAEALVALVDVDHPGPLNVAGAEPMTREAFGRAMLAFWGIDDRGLVRSVRAAEVAPSTPRDLRLDCRLAEMLLDRRFPGVAEVLAEAERLSGASPPETPRA